MQPSDLSCTSGTSRRSFLRMAGITAAAMPILTEGHLAYAALQQAAPRPSRALPPAGAVMINANENPLGPSAAALAAITDVAKTGGRYDATGCQADLQTTYAKQLGIPEDHLVVYAGSSEPLHYSVLAFTSPTASFVTADPSYEAGMRAAQIAGAKVVKVPLTKEYAHDVKAMVSATTDAGVIYICNPNNPTGTLTPKEDIAYALENKPKGSILLVDEAYIHLAGAPDAMEYVAAGKDIIILRTFSKVYGMAGIRCGAAMGRPDLLAKLQKFGMNAMSVTAVSAACASLKDPALVPTRRKIIADTRNQTFDYLRTGGYKFIPSVSNCFMIDTGKPGRQVITAMQAENVFIGRTWPIWPNYVRVSVGTPEEMAKFQTAFTKVMKA
jgi:histidinol-phosphate aminotransferase